MSQLKVNALVSYSGNTVTLGTSGDTINVASGVTFNTASATVNYPAGSISNAAINASAAIATTKLGAGAVLQVVSTIKTDTFTTASASYVDLTGGSVTITPSSASNKILVMAYVVLGNTTSTAGSFFRVVRDSTAIGVGTAVGNRRSASGGTFPAGNYGTGGFGWHLLDSPSSTSSLTYKIQISVESGYTATVGRSGEDSDVAFAGRYPSIITVMEIAG